MSSLSRQQQILVLSAYTLLVLVALGLRLATFDRYLPYLDYPDESNMFLLSVAMRGDEVALADDYGAYVQGDWLAGYPPLYPWLGVWMQRLTEATTNRFLFPRDYLMPLRVMSAGANVLTVVALLALGWSVARPLGAGWAAVAGGLTALPHALSPQILDIGGLAIPDALIPLACVVALLGAVKAIQDDASRWLVVSLLGAVAAIYLKYSLVFTLWATLCGVLVLVRRRGLRGSLHWLAVLAVISAVTAGYLVAGYGALGLENQEADGFRERGVSNLLSVERNLTNLWVALDVSVGLWLFVAVVALGAVTYGLARRRVNLRWLWLLLPYIAGNVLLTSSVVWADLERGGYGRVRYMFPAALALSLLWALAVVQIGLWLGGRGGAGERVGTPNPYRAYRVTVVLGVIALVFVVPALVADAGLIRRYAPPHTNLLLWRWSDASLPPDGKILTARASETHLVWNRPYSGYDGETTFEWLHDENPARGTARSAFDAGIHYFVVTDVDRANVYRSDAMDRFIDSLWHLKTFSADGVTAAGETTSTYRMLPPQTALDVRFGEQIALIGYDLSAMALAPGQTFTFRPYWQSVSTPPTNYSMFVHVYPAGEPTDIVAQFDGAPVSAERLPVTWTDANERLIGADVTLQLPETIEPGTYTLAVGLYDFQTGDRLPVGSADRLTIDLTVLSP